MYEELYHYGIKRKSGRYPWGSGDRPYQGESWRHNQGISKDVIKVAAKRRKINRAKEDISDYQKGLDQKALRRKMQAENNPSSRIKKAKEAQAYQDANNYRNSKWNKRVLENYESDAKRGEENIYKNIDRQKSRVEYKKRLAEIDNRNTIKYDTKIKDLENQKKEVEQYLKNQDDLDIRNYDKKKPLYVAATVIAAYNGLSLYSSINRTRPNPKEAIIRGAIMIGAATVANILKEDMESRKK